MPERVEVRGAGKPGVDVTYEPTFAESMIESLQQQRTRYVQDGKDDLVQKVDETIDYYRGQLPVAQTRVMQAEAAVSQMYDTPEQQAARDDNLPPHPGWIRDRATGEWREPRKPGRRPTSDIRDVEV